MSVHVSSWAWKQRVGDPGAKLVLVKLADNANDEGLAFPGQAKIAGECELSVRSVRYKIAKLADGGFLTVIVRTREDGKRTSNLYQLAIGNQLPVVSEPEAKYDTNQRQPVAGQEPSVEPPVLEKANAFSSESSKSAATNGLASDRVEVRRVYEHWRQVRGKTRANYGTISPARQAKIRSRLREFSVDELFRALDAVALDDWDDRGKHDDLTKLFRSRETVDYWLEVADAPNRHDPDAAYKRLRASMDARGVR